MSWNIGTFYNDLYFPEDIRDEFVELASSQGHYVDFWKEKLLFDSDAMEHQDFMWTEWFEKFVSKNIDIKGKVIWGCLEGDDAGEMWGYVVGKGVVSRLSTADCFKFLYLNEIGNDNDNITLADLEGKL